MLFKATGEQISPSNQGDPAKFFGVAHVHAVDQAMGTDQLAIRHVFFEPGARARPHMHGTDQLLYFPIGGIVAIDGGPDEIVAPGQYVLLPGNRPHMHGAPEDSPAIHISMMREIDFSDFSCPIDPSWERYRAQ